MVANYHALEHQGCSLPHLLLLCAPRMAIQMAWAAQWAAFGPTLETRLASWAVQLVQITGPITGLLVCPTIGVFSDHCTSRFGRRRPFLVVGTLATVVVWVLMMCTSYISDSWRTGYMVTLYVLSGAAVNTAQVPASLIIADFAGDRQVTAYSIAQAYSIVGSLVVSGYISVFGPAHESFMRFMAMLIVILIVTVLPVVFCVKETPFVPETPLQSDVKNGFLAVYHGIKFLPRLLTVYCIGFVLLEFGFAGYNGNKNQYFGLVLNDGNATGADKCPKCDAPQQRYSDGVSLASGLVDTLHLAFGLLYLFVLPTIVRKFGARRVIVFSIVPQTLLVLIFFVRSKILTAVVVTGMSVTQNMVFSMQIPVILHVVGYGELNGLGMFAGAFNSANCLGQLLTFALSPILVTTSLTHALPILVGGVVTILAFLVAFFKFDIRMTTV
ncbi:hypothetical protein SDRG_02449 [Saprolegnia diclina VS20]|uniref:Major facilitator superfamily (MFS) profile domain-containing protein n=1 Tax=Saprolegnia diclina (strain VS20) TaxID=1156394 RepID=T0R0U3_SAPDV|nr:hypothetical protein SDRG_02449 [Saprolegnia diclina VS20]EQC40561.1 hypothetical protein SDRG_02449 [Saprolegnia diclina VS20]|eukprot:XP_008606260.1 hypothetical protein SDRG_02449 [Saprolegnia diclina VS20]